MSTRDNQRQYVVELPQAEEDEGLDAEKLRELLGFVARAPRRRPWLSAFTFILVAAIGLFVTVFMPRTYNAQAKLLAQSNLIVPALSNPNRAVPRDADNPTRNVGDMIVRRDNLVELAQETDLVSRYYAKRSPVLKVKDRLLGGAKTDDDRMRALVGTLEKKLKVTTADNVVTIEVDWDDPQMAYDIVNTVQKNFLDAKYDDQVAMVEDAIQVLKQHAQVEEKDVDGTLADYQTVAAAVFPPRRVAVPQEAPRPYATRVWTSRPAVAVAPGPGVSPDLTAALEDKRAEVKNLEAARQQQLDVVRAQLAQAELTLTAQHPTVMALQQKLDSLTAPNVQLQKARDEERALMQQIAPPVVPVVAAARAPQLEPAAATSAAPAPSAAPAEASASLYGSDGIAIWERDPRTQLAHSKLEAAIHRYQDAMALLDQANIELDVARTAFKYRYSVVSPAEVPRSTKKPMVPIMGASSVLLAVLLAFLAAALADRASGRLFELWQIRRRLDLDVLGEFDVPRLPEGRS